jgi:iron complex outermembrane receptor protein
MGRITGRLGMIGCLSLAGTLSLLGQAMPAPATTVNGNTSPTTAATTNATASPGASAIVNPAAAGTDQTQELAPMIVTGSAIPTTDTEGASPVAVIDAAQIEKRGYVTAEDVLRNLPSNGSFSSPGQTSNNFAAGAAYASLRGLGPQATLVLINGRRVSDYAESANGQYAFVDLNNIPAQIIDRVEVLTEGTAIYGSDAVAGVVNIITKKSLGSEDGEADFYIGNTDSKDAFTQRYTIMGNLASLDKNGFGLIEADYESQNSVFAGDRGISSNANQSGNGGFDLRSGRVYPGEFLAENTVNPASGVNNIFTIAPGNGNVPLTGTTAAADPGQVVDDPFFDEPNPYNYNTDTSIIPETQRFGTYLNYTYKFYDGAITPNIDFDYRHNRTILTSAPAGTAFGDAGPPETSIQATDALATLFGNAPGGPSPVFIVPTTNPFNHTGDQIDILAYRFIPLGPRIETVNNDVFRAVPSVDFKLGDGWTLNMGLNYSYSFVNDVGTNFPSNTGFQNALNSTNPATAFNPFTSYAANTPASLAAVTTQEGQRDTSSLIAEDFRFNGKLFDLPAGPVQMAFGGEYRLERFNQAYGEADSTGNIVSSSTQLDTAASQKDLSGYTEVDIPITSPSFNAPGFYSMDVQVAGRVDKYSQFGSTENPQVRLRWETIPGLILRGGYSTSFRAPSLNELAAGGNQAFETVADPVTGTLPEILVNSPGNPNLKPEEAETFSFGVAYSPTFVPGLKFTADYFKIIYKGQIEQTDPQTLIDSGSPLVIRDAAGDISSVTATYENLSSSWINGVDLSIDYVVGDPYANWGQLDINYSSEVLFNYITNDGLGATQNVGEDSAGLGPYSRYRQDVSATWNYNNFSFTVANNFFSGYDDTLAQPSNTDGEGDINGNAIERNVASYITFDLQASYEFDKQQIDKFIPGPRGQGFDWRTILDGTKVIVGCNNVYDFQPPFTANPSDTLGYDPAYADPTGRFLYAEINKKF